MKDSCQLGSYTGCEPKDCQTVQFISYKLLDLIPRENYKLLAIECILYRRILSFTKVHFLNINISFTFIGLILDVYGWMVKY